MIISSKGVDLSMNTIIKHAETMTSRERVRRALSFEPYDRVPIDYSTNPTIHNRLCDYLGIPTVPDSESLLEYLGVDYRGINVPYIGKPLFPVLPGMDVNPVYGFYSRWIVNRFGGYNDFCYFPLKDADEETIASWPTPDPDDFDYSRIAPLAEKWKDKAIYTGSAGICDIINSIGRVMGMEDTLVNLQLGDEATLTLMERKIGFELAVMERTLDTLHKIGRDADFIWIGEDLGTQIAPMISHELFDRVFRPQMERFIRLADSYHLPVMIHTCGSSSWCYPDFIDMGIRAVDTLQPEAVNMNPAYLKEHFGGKLAFHGCISTAMLAEQDTAGVDRICRETMETLVPCGGYQFAPTHAIQDNTPVENIIAMYNAAHRYSV